MFRMIAIGFCSLIGVTLFGLQGLATWQKQDTDKNGVLGIVELYKSAPGEAERLTTLAMKTCLEDRSGGKLPAYYTDIMAGSAAAAFRTDSQNGFDTTQDPAVQTFVAEIQEAVSGRVSKIAKRMTKEPQDVQNRLNASMNWITGNGRAAMDCVGLNVARLAAAEQQSSSLSYGNA
ncbi:MAG: hypothetical protein AAGF81_14610 [Pseudomonadota bacterium]